MGYRGSFSDRHGWIAYLVVLGFLIGAVLTTCVAGLGWRSRPRNIVVDQGWRSRPRNIVVDQRWWAAWTYVKYDTTAMVWDSNLETWVVETDTTTRCTAELIGTEMPITYPEPACQVFQGDYISHNQGFYIEYHLEDRTERKIKTFWPQYWADLVPGRAVRVKWNLLQIINEVEGLRE